MKKLDKELIKAIEKKDLSAVIIAIEKGADINTALDDDSGDLAIHKACFVGSLDIVKYLHGKGADINSPGYGQPPLSVASNLGHLDIVEYLAPKIDDINYQDESGRTALHYAAMSKVKHIAPLIECLIKNGAKTTLIDEDGQTAQNTLDDFNSGYTILVKKVDQKKK